MGASGITLRPVDQLLLRLKGCFVVEMQQKEPNVGQSGHQLPVVGKRSRRYVYEQDSENAYRVFHKGAAANRSRN